MQTMIIHRTILPSLITGILFLSFACSHVVESIVCNRYTALSTDEYRLEQGMLTRSGFTPTVSLQLPYNPQVGSREEIEKLSGKLVLTLGLWESMPKPDFCKRSRETYALGGVPIIIINTNLP